MNGINISHAKKKRRVGTLKPIVHQFYIFCEGKKTETNYFGGFRDAIEQNPVYKNAVHIEITGLGMNTLRVVEKAEEFVEENAVSNAQVWCVYDKDDFPDQNFNGAFERICSLSNFPQNEKRHVKYYAAWSNECFEYWFILHFQNYVENEGRKEYYRILDSYFARSNMKKFHVKHYDKTNNRLFQIMTEAGNPKEAIFRAKMRRRQYSQLPPAKEVPATRVYELVLKLAEYLPEYLKRRYL